ncbi:LysR family transcriptional regulator [Pontiella sp.]|uniref:LysR family transcriptional regulator n=1 Tax=Pontiella sp. TaxID=2837462 RepID=UPI00356ADEF7
MSTPSSKLEADLHTLRSLVAVVEEGGFSAAAKRVHRTQSAVSVQIAKLEDQLNAKLLERTSRSVSLTPKGEAFLSYARRILELADEAMAACTAEEKALLRVGVAEYLAPRHLDSVLGSFQEAHPNCNLSLTLGLGPPLLERLEQGGLDLVIGGPEGSNGNKLWDEPLVWTGSGEVPEDRSAALKLVLMPAPCIYRKIAFDALTGVSRPWVMSIEANSFEAVQAAIRAGLGITVLPEAAIKDGMTVLKGKLPALPDSCVMSYTRAKVSHPFTQPFIDDLVESVERLRRDRDAG